MCKLLFTEWSQIRLTFTHDYVIMQVMPSYPFYSKINLSVITAACIRGNIYQIMPICPLSLVRQMRVVLESDWIVIGIMCINSRVNNVPPSKWFDKTKFPAYLQRQAVQDRVACILSQTTKIKHSEVGNTHLFIVARPLVK